MPESAAEARRLALQATKDAAALDTVAACCAWGETVTARATGLHNSTLHRLARLMGQGGERVILIDSDLRRPTQHRLAGRSRDPGLSDLLLGQKTLDEVIQKNVSTGLDFIPSGSNRRGVRKLSSVMPLTFCTIAPSTSVTVSPAKAWTPVSISNSTTPNAQISVRLSRFFPRACSGLM